MRRADLTKRLIGAANEAERRQLLVQNHTLADEQLAREIRTACFAAWAVEPVRAQRAELAMRSLVKVNNRAPIPAIGLWVSGIADLTRGKFESAIVSIDKASRDFVAMGRAGDSAQALVAKLMALAMLGRYGEAIATGRKALRTFVSLGDEFAAARVEMNLSNITARRSQHRAAEKYCLSARERFKKVSERGWQAMAENGLANTYAELNDFEKADEYYRMALEGARFERLTVTEAEIEASLGKLAMLRGRYAEALNFLESSRQRYDQLGMPHQSAIADLEIADIYSELNLGAEASEIYANVAGAFHKLKLSAEEARARLNHGRTAAAAGDVSTANRELKRALKLFECEQNPTGRASVLLARAKLAIDKGKLKTGLPLLDEATAAAKLSENPRHQVGLRLLEAEVLRLAGKDDEAATKFAEANRLGLKFKQEDAVYHSSNARGKMAAARGKWTRAKRLFNSAIASIENMRSPLAAEEFSMAYLASKLEPFDNLARLYIERNRVAEAFGVIENGRSRSLLDAIRSRAGDPSVSPKLQLQLSELRTELNAYYKRFDSAVGSEADRLRVHTVGIEARIVKTVLKVRSLALPRSGRAGKQSDPFDIDHLQTHLGDAATLIEFVEFDGRVSAFVINGKKLRYVAELARSADIAGALEDLRFQFGAMRYGNSLNVRFSDELKERTDVCLRRLYDLLLRPIERYISGGRLVIVPVGLLNYVPFNALHDGSAYMVEKYESTQAPSAAVWSILQGRAAREVKNSLLIGYADERIPLVEDEIREISDMLPHAKIFVGAEATYSAYMANASKYDLIYLACHGKFRPESPMFSSLHLADGWITVSDICSQDLHASVVTLSACETGVSKVFAGEEILGLARGFLSAGADNLIVRLWSVNDEAAGHLMRDLYQNLQRSGSISASLRDAQMRSIRSGRHPFYWSPFILVGK